MADSAGNGDNSSTRVPKTVTSERRSVFGLVGVGRLGMMLAMQADCAWGAVAELAASQHGAFHRRQAAEHQLSNRRLARAVERGGLTRPLPDVFVLAGAPATWHQKLMINSLSGAVVSHRAAAALHGLDGFRHSIVELTMDRRQSIRTTAVLVHEWSNLDPNDTTVVDGIRCTNIAATLCQLGSVVSDDKVEQALDSALRDGASALWIAQSLDRLWRPGPSGVGSLRRLLDDPRRAGALPDSMWERLLQQILSIPGLPPPTLQYPLEVVGSDGRPKTRWLDLGFGLARLGVAGHSREHHFGRQAVDGDHERDLEIAAVGWELIYVTWSMAARPDLLARRIAEVYRTRIVQLENGHHHAS